MSSSSYSLARLRKVFTRKADAPDAVDEDALLAEMERSLGPELQHTLAAFDATSECPSAGLAAGEAGQAEARRFLLLRYLRAEKRDVAKAVARLKEQAAWRRGFGAVTEEDVAAELATGKVKIQAPGPASSGRPLIVIKGSRHRPGATPQLMQQFIFYCLEATCHYCWAADSADQKFVCCVDLSGLAVKNLDAVALRACFTMLAIHFPERMAAVYMLDAPTIFWGIWKLVEPFIDSTARKNVHFVFGQAGRTTLVESLGPEVVPLEYGGQAAEIPVEIALRQLPAWQQKQQQRAQDGQGAAAAAGSPAAAAAGQQGQQGGGRLRVGGSSPNLVAGTVAE